jgi:hypothetical protein
MRPRVNRREKFESADGFCRGKKENVIIPNEEDVDPKTTWQL